MIQASKPLTVRLPLNWYLMGHSWPLFSLSLSFQQLTVNKFFIFADDWIRSAYLWYQNRPLCLLSSNTAKAVKCNLTGFCPMRNCSLKIQAKFNSQDTLIESCWRLLLPSWTVNKFEHTVIRAFPLAKVKFDDLF